MSEWIAKQLRRLATRIDGREQIDAHWHRVSVEGMNRYIVDTQAQIAMLRGKLEAAHVAVDRMRDRG